MKSLLRCRLPSFRSIYCFVSEVHKKCCLWEAGDTFWTFSNTGLKQLFACKPHMASTTENLLGEGVNLVFTMYHFLESRQTDAIHTGWKITHIILPLLSVIFAVISSHHILALSANVDICSWQRQVGKAQLSLFRQPI